MHGLEACTCTFTVSHLKATEASLHVAGGQTVLSTYSNSLSEPLPRSLVEVTLSYTLGSG